MIRANTEAEFDRLMVEARFVEGAASIDVKLPRYQFSETMTISFAGEVPGRVTCSCTNFRMALYKRGVAFSTIHENPICRHIGFAKSELQKRQAQKNQALDFGQVAA